MVTLVVPLPHGERLFNTAVAGWARGHRAAQHRHHRGGVAGCFLIGAFWAPRACRLLASGNSRTFLLNFPRTSASLGVAFGDVVRTWCARCSLAGHGGRDRSARPRVGEWALPWRSTTLIAVGSVAYLVTITLITATCGGSFVRLCFTEEGTLEAGGRPRRAAKSSKT